MKAIILCAFALAGVSLAEDAAKTPEELLIAGNDAFTGKLFYEVQKAQPSRSVVFSAYSVLTPLAQLALAATGESHDQLLKAIGMPDDAATKAAFPLLNKRLRAVKGVDLRTASKIYIPTNFELTDNYKSLSRDVFGSEVKNVDFTDNVATASEINQWVENETNNKIKDLVSADSLGVSTRALLVNAIYFKGSWETKFNAAETKDRDFHVTKEKTVSVPTMHRKGNFKIGMNNELQAKILEIPYEGGEASFVIILPNEIDGINNLQEKLKEPSALRTAMDKMYTIEVDAYIPKFKIESTINLKDVLPKIGVSSIFDVLKANLVNLLKTEDPLFVTEAIQKAFIEVNEEGAEAAAANEFGITYLSAIISEPFVFDANRPFVFQLKEGNTTIFSGVYYE